MVVDVRYRRTGAACIAAWSMAPATALPAPVTLYENARIWTGSGFAAGRLAVREERFVDPSGAPPDAVRVDVAGGYVVPAYGNAHAHVTPADAAGSWAFAGAGVFYAWNPNTVVMGDGARAFWARPDAYDVKIAQGGITEPRGHPEAVYVDVLSKYRYPGRPRGWFVGNAFHYGRNRAEIDAALARLTAQKADFVKAYLLHSERYAEILGDKRFHGARGMNPVHLPYLVTEAKKRGLRVVVHVETGHDLRIAAMSGAHMAAHLPGYNGETGELGLSAKRLTVADAALIARTGMLVVATYGVIRGDPFNVWDRKPPMPSARALTVQVRNIRLLQAAGATLLTGTDGRGPINREVEHLVRIGALTAREAAVVALGTGAKLFPERRIGCFEPGCEADFLVLDADPMRDIRALRSIRRRVMAGAELKAPVGAVAAPVD